MQTDRKANRYDCLLTFQRHDQTHCVCGCGQRPRFYCFRNWEMDWGEILKKSTNFWGYYDLVTAARDNDRLKQHVRNLMSTDMAREYKKLSKEHGQVKEKYSGLVERFNENVNDYNELLEENKSLKSKISDLKRDVSLIYESTKEFLKERTDGLKAFKNVFKGFVDKVKDKTAQFQEKHDLEPKKNEFELTHNREVKKERSRDQGMSL